MAEFVKAIVKGKEYKIPTKDLEPFKKLGMTPKECVDTWLLDHDILKSKSVEELQKKTKALPRKYEKAEKPKTDKPKATKPKTVKISDEKKELFGVIKNAFANYDLQVVKENKLCTIAIGDKIFKLDLIETRPPKK